VTDAPPSRTYTVRRAVGRGSFGTVYEGRVESALGFEKRVALKVLNPDMAALEQAVQRLRDEARILGLVRHSAIVGVDDLVRLDGRWVLVMEFVDGVGLDQIIREAETPPGVALDIVARAAGALAAALRQPGPDGQPLRLLHRDLKPSNVHITAAGEVKLLDFGIARAEFAAREADTRSLMLGSLAYMAPERLDRVDTPAGDVYALGVVLYELLLRDRFGTTFAHQPRHMAHLSDRVARARALPVGGAELGRMLAQVLTFEPADRPTATELQDQCLELRDAIGGERLERWARRVVPAVQARAPEPEPGDLSGLTLGPQATASGARLPADPAAVTGLRPNQGPPPAGDLHHAATAPGGDDPALHAHTEPGVHHDLLGAPTTPGGAGDPIHGPTTPSGAAPPTDDLHHAATAPSAEPTAPLPRGAGGGAAPALDAPAPAAPPPRRSPRTRWVLLALGGLVAVAVTLVGARYLTTAPTGAPAATAADPLPVGARPRRKPGAPAPVAATPKRRPAPRAAPPPEPEPSAPEVTPTPAPTRITGIGRVRFAGGADRLRLSQGDQTIILLDGMRFDLAAGVWGVTAVFDGSRVPVRELEITVDGDLTLTCDPVGRVCDVAPTSAP